MIASLPMKSADPRAGTLIAGRFRLGALIGEGQMAKVYVAEQISMQLQVALEIVPPGLVRGKSAPIRFRREALAVTRLRSPHSIVFYDFGATDDGTLYIAMELLVGEPLRIRLSRDRVLTPRMIVDIV